MSHLSSVPAPSGFPVLSRSPLLSADLVASDGLLAALEQTGRAAAILGANGRVLSLTAQAHRYIGPAVRLEEGRLSATFRNVDDRLQKFIAELVGPAHPRPGGGSAFVVLPQPCGRPLILRGTTIAGSKTDLFQSAKAFVTFIDIGQHTPPKTALLRELFGLTAKESDVATAIADGQELHEIAQQRGIAKATVKSQLRTVFAKTGTRRQVSLAVLVTKLQSVSDADG